MLRDSLDLQLNVNWNLSNIHIGLFWWKNQLYKYFAMKVYHTSVLIACSMLEAHMQATL